MRSHATLHARAHDVTPKGHEVAAREADGVHADETRGEHPKRRENGIGPLAEETPRNHPQNLGERQVDRSNRQRTDEVGHEEVHLPLVIREKAREEALAGVLFACGVVARGARHVVS